MAHPNILAFVGGRPHLSEGHPPLGADRGSGAGHYVDDNGIVVIPKAERLRRGGRGVLMRQAAHVRPG